MAKTRQPSPNPDLLAAVVLDTLVAADGQPLTRRQIALACERNPKDEDERQEVSRALEVLVRDQLAISAGDWFHATRAAIRAAQLSF